MTTYISFGKNYSDPFAVVFVDLGAKLSVQIDSSSTYYSGQISAYTHDPTPVSGTYGPRSNYLQAISGASDFAAFASDVRIFGELYYQRNYVLAGGPYGNQFGTYYKYDSTDTLVTTEGYVDSVEFSLGGTKATVSFDSPAPASEIFGAGTDLVIDDSVTSARNVFALVLKGSDLPDVVYDSRGADDIRTGGGNDRIYFSWSDDQIDVLYGGAGADMFVFDSFVPAINEDPDFVGGITDRIMDFEEGDILRFSFYPSAGTILPGDGTTVGDEDVQYEITPEKTRLYFGSDTVPGAEYTVDLYGDFTNHTFRITGNDITVERLPAVLYLDFSAPIPVRFVPTKVPFFSGEFISVRDGESHPRDYISPEKRAAIAAATQKLFDDSGLPITVVTTPPDEAHHTVRFGSKVVFDKDGDGQATNRLLGKAYMGVDTFNLVNNDIVAVLMGETDDTARIASTIAHEFGHAIGMFHINTVGYHREIMDYHDAQNEHFMSVPVDMYNPPLDSNVLNPYGGTHNPVYHAERYFLGTAPDELVKRGIFPGSYDVGLWTKVKHYLNIGDLTETLYDVSVAVIGGPTGSDGADVVIGIADVLNSGDMLEVEVPPGASLAIIARTQGASLPNVTLDFGAGEILGAGQTIDGAVSFYKAVAGGVPVLVGTGAGATQVAEVGRGKGNTPTQDDDVLVVTGPPLFAQGGDDVIVGTAMADVAFGEAGQDLMAGLDGNDSLAGGAGEDDIDGGPGDDVLFGDDLPAGISFADIAALSPAELSALFDHIA